MQQFIGQSIGRYHILEQLGEGGMAVVYKAFDTNLNCDVAVKFIRIQKLSGDNNRLVLKRFKTEAQKTAALIHPNIVPVTDYGEHDGIPYLVMKYLPSGTLKQALQQRMHSKAGPYPYREAAAILAPIARALDTAHQSGLVHRDVKPSNILLTPGGQPMLTDFGVAKILESDETFDQTGLGIGIGAPAYMAPEQWEGKDIDGRADVYALGITFYELITGRVPYQADTVPAILIKVMRDPLPRPQEFVKGIPDEVERVLVKALARDKQHRYPDMASFAAALEQLSIQDFKGSAPQPIPIDAADPGAGHQVFDAPTGPTPAPAQHSPRGRWWPWALGGVAAVALIAVLLRNLFPGDPLAGTDPTATVAPAQTAGSQTLAAPALLPTQAVSTPTAASGEPAILFSEDFEDGKVQDITYIADGWQVITD
ncbi:MAG: protein kinase, partial [Chloroflexi bacterium]|nr:protein kinase [Chloroflexota bacterium]